LQFLSTLYKTYAVESAADVIQGFFGAVDFSPYILYTSKNMRKQLNLEKKFHQIIEINQKSNTYISI
jgi:hypothetical protein